MKITIQRGAEPAQTIEAPDDVSVTIKANGDVVVGPVDPLRNLRKQIFGPGDYGRIGGPTFGITNVRQGGWPWASA